MADVQPVGLAGLIEQLQLEIPPPVVRSEGVQFLLTFDAAFRAAQSVVDMPDARIRLLVRLLMQNQGRLSSNKRDSFSFLTDIEIAEIENRIQAILADPPPVPGTP